MSDKTTSKGWFKSALSKLNRVMSEDMSEYDEDADYDTRVKLPEWQLAALKKRKRDLRCQQKQLVRIENDDVPQIKLHGKLVTHWNIDVTMGQAGDELTIVQS